MAMQETRPQTVYFLREPDGRSTSLTLADFPTNSHVPEFSPQQEAELVGLLHRSSGNGVLHIRHGGAPILRKPTGEMLMESLPQRLMTEKLYDTVNIVTPAELDTSRRSPYWNKYLEGRYVVVDPETGEMSLADRQRLEKLVMNATIIIAGGGPAHPDDPRYQHEREVLAEAFKKKIRYLGVCMGYQLALRIFGIPMQDEAYELGSTVHQTTVNGKVHIATRRLGDAYTIFAANNFRGQFPPRDLLEGMHVLCENAVTNQPTMIAIRKSIILSANHPEIDMGYYEMGSDGPQYRGVHPNLLGIMAQFHRSPKDLAPYNISEADFLEMLRSGRTPRKLGERFYGPVLLHLARVGAIDNGR